MVTHAFYPRTWRPRQADLLSWRPGLHSWVLEQPEFHSETLSWKKKKKGRKEKILRDVIETLQLSSKIESIKSSYLLLICKEIFFQCHEEMPILYFSLRNVY